MFFTSVSTRAAPAAFLAGEAPPVCWLLMAGRRFSGGCLPGAYEPLASRFAR
jgi:hypothetical protein